MSGWLVIRSNTESRSPSEPPTFRENVPSVAHALGDPGTASGIAIVATGRAGLSTRRTTETRRRVPRNSGVILALGSAAPSSRLYSWGVERSDGDRSGTGRRGVAVRQFVRAEAHDPCRRVIAAVQCSRRRPEASSCPRRAPRASCRRRSQAAVAAVVRRVAAPRRRLASRLRRLPPSFCQPRL